VLHGQPLLYSIDQTTKWSSAGVLKVDQLHMGLPVEAARLSIHYDPGGTVRMIHGKLAKNLPSRQAKITESAALQAALRSIGAEKYAWQDSTWEEQLKLDLDDSNASFYPIGGLVFARRTPEDNFSASNFVLSYRFEIRSSNPPASFEVLIDAQTGQVIRKLPLAQDAWGTVSTLYNGNRGFTTQWRGFPYNDYVLKDQSNGDKLHTLRWDSQPWWLRGEVNDTDNSWTGASATTHWATQVAWEYFWSSFNRNGLNNAGGKIRIESEWNQAKCAMGKNRRI
jgi:Zn-dependent metalloprotease